MSVGAKRRREANAAAELLRQSMLSEGIPDDSCITVCAVLREGLRVLGYRADIQPVRVRLFIPGGKTEFANIGYDEPTEGRYPAHVLVVVDRKLAVDPTVSQMGGAFRRKDREASMLFDVEREFLRGEPERLEYRKWTVQYEAFNDGGLWARDMTADIAREVRESGQRLARLVRP